MATKDVSRLRKRRKCDQLLSVEEKLYIQYLSYDKVSDGVVASRNKQHKRKPKNLQIRKPRYNVNNEKTALTHKYIQLYMARKD